MSGVVWWVFQTLIVTALLAAVIVVVSPLLRRRPAALHLLWLIVLVKFVSPSHHTWTWRLGNVEGLSVIFITPPTSTVGTQPGHAFVESVTSVTPPNGGAPIKSTTAHPQVVDPPTGLGKIAASSYRSDRWWVCVLGVWIAGTSLVALRQVTAIRRLSRISAAARPAPERIGREVKQLAQRLGVPTIPALTSDDVASPFVFCWGKLRLLWPSILSQDPVGYRGVFAHELAHVKRRDHWVTYIELLATCLWWWNPMLWIVRRRLRESAEFACDAVALRTITGDRRRYAEQFLSLCQPADDSVTAAPMLGMGTRGGRSMRRRIAMIMSDDVSGQSTPIGFAIALILGMLAWPGWSLGQNVDPPSKTPTASITESDSSDPDSDGDGLSDFQERHKYRTDPHESDSDGDGKPDGDRHERREYTYTIRSIVRVMQPCGRDPISDDYQDARVLDETSEYVELEVVHYPLATGGEAIESNRDWRSEYAGMTEYLRPRINTNWDDKMRADLLRELRANGIEIDQLNDKQVVQRVADWFLSSYRALPMFNALHVHYPEGSIAVIPGRDIDLEDQAWGLSGQFERELLGRSMFYHKTRGSCTSSAMALTTVLRAVGIPTRMVLAIPIIDGSDPNQVSDVGRLSHHRVRGTILDSVSRLGNSFASHTYNEVYVGRRWHRLNYNHLGQPILDNQMLGLATHVHRFNDLSEWGLQPTWGARYAAARSSDVFAFSNPYATIALTDRFGQHASVANAPTQPASSLKQFSISKVYWFHSEDRPKAIRADSFKRDGSGHLLMHVDQSFDMDRFSSLYREVDKQFTLTATGKPVVPLRAERGFWGNEFYLHVRPEDYSKMAAGIPYQLGASNAEHWKITDALTIVKRGPAPVANAKPNRFKITKAYWFHSGDRPKSIGSHEVDRDGSGHILVHVEDDFSRDDRWPSYTKVDKRFLLKASGHPDVPVRAERGYWGSEFYLRIQPDDLSKMREHQPYSLVPINGGETVQWVVDEGVTISKVDSKSLDEGSLLGFPSASPLGYRR